VVYERCRRESIRTRRVGSRYMNDRYDSVTLCYSQYLFYILCMKLQDVQTQTKHLIQDSAWSTSSVDFPTSSTVLHDACSQWESKHALLIKHDIKRCRVICECQVVNWYSVKMSLGMSRDCTRLQEAWRQACIISRFKPKNHIG
jgi:hypothetical protein